MADVEKAHLSHTESHTSIQNVWINGVRAGETTIIAAAAGCFNIPLVLVTGDRAVCLEAESLIPRLETVAVKEGLSHGAAISLTPIKTRGMIKEGARKAMAKARSIEPFKLKAPIELVVEFTEGSKSSTEILSKKPSVKQVDARTIKIEGSDLKFFKDGFKEHTSDRHAES